MLTVITAEFYNHMIFLRYIEKINSLTEIYVELMLTI